MNEFTLFKYEMFPIVSCLAENSGCICISFRDPITVHIFGRILRAPCKVYSFIKSLVELWNYYRSRSFVSTIRNPRMRMTIRMTTEVLIIFMKILSNLDYVTCLPNWNWKSWTLIKNSRWIGKRDETQIDSHGVKLSIISPFTINIIRM